MEEANGREVSEVSETKSKTKDERMNQKLVGWS